jgi:hypothetical protein
VQRERLERQAEEPQAPPVPALRRRAPGQLGGAQEAAVQERRAAARVEAPLPGEQPAEARVARPRWLRS